MASLETLPFPRLLLGLLREGFTGWLVLSRPGLTRRFELQAGLPVRVESSVARESLREHLLRRGLLEAADRDRVAAELAGRPGGELPAIARLRRVAPRELLLALAEHVRQNLVDAVGWSDGEFALEPAANPRSAGAPPLPLDLVVVMCEALAESWRADRTLASLGPRAEQFPVPAPELEAVAGRLPRHPDLDALRASLDGTRAAWALLHRHPSPICHAALFVLDALGALVWRETPGEAPQHLAAGGPEIEIVVGTGSAAASEVGPAAPRNADPRSEARGTEAAAVRARILELHEQLGELDHYAILGVDRKANAAAIKRAYLQLAKRLHPDAVARQGLDDVKAQANDVFAEITEAHEVLCDLEQRRSYDASLEGHSAVDAQQVAQAESLFRRGEVLMKAGNFAGALPLLEGAVRLWPEEGDYQAALGWTLFKKNPPELERARRHLERGLALAPRAAQVHFRLHLVLKAEGDTKAAGEALARARALDPKVG